jgi:hypothetical protein
MDKFLKKKKSIMLQDSFFIQETCVSDHSPKQNLTDLKNLPVDPGLQKKIYIYRSIIIMIKMKLEEHICKNVLVNLLITNSHKVSLVESCVDLIMHNPTTE